MPSVLLVTQNLNLAGAQRQCVELALGLHSLPNWSVEVAVLEPGGSLTSDLEAARIPLHPCPRRWRWDLSPATRLASLVRQRGFWIVHSYLFLPNFYARLARVLHRPPLVVSSLRSTGVGAWPRFVIELLTTPLCDVVIANSEKGRRELLALGVRSSRVVVVRNGVALDRFRPAPDPASMLPSERSGPRIGMVAQLEVRKDPLGLVDAFALVLRHYPTARLVLAGDGTLRPRVEARIRSHAIRDSVALLGTCRHPEDLYPTLDVYVQASAAEEGTSNSIVEAMASAVPVVATDVGGNREVVTDGEAGLVVPPRDPALLANAIVSLLRQPSLARQMGMAGRARAQNQYSRESMVASTVSVYETFLSRRTAHTPREQSL